MDSKILNNDVVITTPVKLTLAQENGKDFNFSKVPECNYICVKHADFKTFSFFELSEFGFSADFNKVVNFKPLVLRDVLSAVYFLLYRRFPTKPTTFYTKLLGGEDKAKFVDSTFQYFGEPGVLQMPGIKWRHDEFNNYCDTNDEQREFVRGVLLLVWVYNGDKHYNMMELFSMATYLEKMSTLLINDHMTHLCCICVNADSSDSNGCCTNCAKEIPYLNVRKYKSVFRTFSMSSIFGMKSCFKPDESVIRKMRAETPKKRQSPEDVEDLKADKRTFLQKVLTKNWVGDLNDSEEDRAEKRKIAAEHNSYITYADENPIEEVFEPLIVEKFSKIDKTRCEVHGIAFLEEPEEEDVEEEYVNIPEILQVNEPKPSLIDTIGEVASAYKDQIGEVFLQFCPDEIKNFIKNIKMDDLLKQTKLIGQVALIVAVPIVTISLAGSCFFKYQKAGEETLESVNWDESMTNICTKGASIIGVIAILAGGVGLAVLEGFKSVLVLKGIMSMVLGTPVKWGLDDIRMMHPIDTITQGVFDEMSKGSVSDLIYHSSTLIYYDGEKRTTTIRSEAQYFGIIPDGGLTISKYMNILGSSFAESATLAVILGIIGGVITSCGLYHLMKPKNKVKIACGICRSNDHTTETHVKIVEDDKTLKTLLKKEKFTPEIMPVKKLNPVTIKCEYCDGNHISEKCFKKFPELKNKPIERGESKNNPICDICGGDHANNEHWTLHNQNSLPESRIPPCGNCFKFGHKTAQCRLAKKQSWVKKENQVKTEVKVPVKTVESKSVPKSRFATPEAKAQSIADKARNAQVAVGSEVIEPKQKKNWKNTQSARQKAQKATGGGGAAMNKKVQKFTAPQNDQPGDDFTLRPKIVKVMKFSVGGYDFAQTAVQLLDRFGGKREELVAIVETIVNRTVKAIKSSNVGGVIPLTASEKKNYFSAFQQTLARTLNAYCLRRNIPRATLFAPIYVMPAIQEIVRETGIDWQDGEKMDALLVKELMKKLENPEWKERCSHCPGYHPSDKCWKKFPELKPSSTRSQSTDKQESVKYTNKDIEVLESLNHSHSTSRVDMNSTVPLFNAGHFVYNATYVKTGNKCFFVTPYADWEKYPDSYFRGKNSNIYLKDIVCKRIEDMLVIMCKELGGFMSDLKLKPLDIMISDGPRERCALYSHFMDANNVYKYSIGQDDCLHKDGRYYYTITTTGGICGSPLMGASFTTSGKILGIHAYGGAAKGDKAMNSSLSFSYSFLEKLLDFWGVSFNVIPAVFSATVVSGN